MLQKIKYCAINVLNEAQTLRSPHSKDQLEGSGPAVPAGGDGDVVVIIVRNVAKARAFCPQCGK